jgi:hypothetical protein
MELEVTRVAPSWLPVKAGAMKCLEILFEMDGDVAELLSWVWGVTASELPWPGPVSNTATTDVLANVSLGFAAFGLLHENDSNTWLSQDWGQP